MVHPKTDEQRKRLAEAVSKSFLFRALDPEQYKEVLDAIFERKVSKQLSLSLSLPSPLIVKEMLPP